MKKNDKITMELAGIRGDLAIISSILQRTLKDDEQKKEITIILNRNIERFNVLKDDYEKQNNKND